MAVAEIECHFLRTALRTPDGFPCCTPGVKSTSNESAANWGLADSRGRKKLHDFIILQTCREQTLPKPLSAVTPVPLEPRCYVRAQPAEDTRPFEALVAQVEAWYGAMHNSRGRNPNVSPLFNFCSALVSN